MEVYPLNFRILFLECVFCQQNIKSKQQVFAESLLVTSYHTSAWDRVSRNARIVHINTKE